MFHVPVYSANTGEPDIPPRVAVGDLVVGIALVKELLEPPAAAVVEPVGAGEQQLAGLAKRVWFAAPVAGGVGLGALAAPVNSPVRQPHDAGTGPRQPARRRPGSLRL